MASLAEPTRKTFKALFINEAGVALFGWAYKLRYRLESTWRFVPESGGVYIVSVSELFRVVDHE